jgi:hypothetical protein
MNTDLVVRKSGVHFRNVVLRHVARRTGFFLLSTASHSRMAIR